MCLRDVAPHAERHVTNTWLQPMPFTGHDATTSKCTRELATVSVCLCFVLESFELLQVIPCVLFLVVVGWGTEATVHVVVLGDMRCCLLLITTTPCM